MKHILTLLIALLLVPLATLPAADSSLRSSKKPNIVFTLADDAGIGGFSAYGCNYGVTPNIDRLGTKAPLELYDLKANPTEQHNLAAAHPDIVQKIESIMAAEHKPSPYYDAPEQSQKETKKPGKKKAASLPELLNEENSNPKSDKK